MREKIREKGKAEAPKTLKMPVFSRVLDLKLDKSRFTQTVHTAQALYGKQLEVNIDRASIDTILDKYLCYYPKQFHFLLKERIETVLMEQQKKLF